MTKNKKGLLVLVVFLVISYFIISIIFSKLNEYKNTVFIGDSTKVNVINGNIKVHNESKEVSKQNVKIYFKNDFVDGYIFTVPAISSSTGYTFSAYNEKNEQILPTSIFLAHTKDIILKVRETTTTEIYNLAEIDEFLKQNNINISSKEELDYYEKSVIDADQTIYSIGLTDKTTYKSFVFMKKENKYILLSSEESEHTDINNVRLKFAKLIDFNNDSNYEFVILKSMSEYGPNYYDLYNFDGNNFTKIGVEK